MRSEDKTVSIPAFVRNGTRLTAGAVVFAVLTLAGCGSDESTQDRYCDAGDSLRSSVRLLADINPIADGTDALKSAANQVRTDAEELQAAASDAAADEVTMLRQAVDQLVDAVSAFGDDLTRDNASSIGEAVQAVSAAAGPVFATLTDC